MKIRIGILLTFVLLLSLCAGTSACENLGIAGPHPSYTLPPYTLQPKQEPTLLSCETTDVDGVEVELSLYHDNGVLVRTASVVDEDQKANLDFAQLDIAIAEQNALDYKELQNTQYKVLASTLPFYSDFSNSGTSPQNPDCYVGHSGKWYSGRVGGRFAAELDSLYVGAVFNGSGNADKIILNQEVSRSSSSLSFSIPAGMGWSAGSNSAIWRSSEYENMSLVGAYPGGTFYTAGIIEAGFTVSSSSQLQKNGLEYTSWTSSSYYNH